MSDLERADAGEFSSAPDPLRPVQRMASLSGGRTAARMAVAALPIHHPELEAVFRQTVGKSARTICVTAATLGEGVTTFALALARRGAAGGLKTLFVDADVARGHATSLLGLSPRFWSPSELSPRTVVRVERYGFGVLPAPIGADPLTFRSRDTLRRMFDAALKDFDLIVVDTTAIGDATDYSIPAEVVAAACDATILVVLANVTSEHLVRMAVSRLAAADARLWGAVMNDRSNPSLADELCRQAGRLAPVAPGLARSLQRLVRSSALLNMQVG